MLAAQRRGELLHAQSWSTGRIARRRLAVQFDHQGLQQAARVDARAAAACTDVAGIGIVVSGAAGRRPGRHQGRGWPGWRDSCGTVGGCAGGRPSSHRTGGEGQARRASVRLLDRARERQVPCGGRFVDNGTPSAPPHSACPSSSPISPARVCFAQTAPQHHPGRHARSLRATLNSAPPLQVLEGYAPFCRLHIAPQLDLDTLSCRADHCGQPPSGCAPTTRRADAELPVLVRWFEGIEPPVANYLIPIPYSREQLAKEGSPITADWGVVGCMYTMQPEETPDGTDHHTAQRPRRWPRAARACHRSRGLRPQRGVLAPAANWRDSAARGSIPRRRTQRKNSGDRVASSTARRKDCRASRRSRVGADAGVTRR